MDKSFSSVGNGQMRRFLQGNTATSGKKTVQYIETDPPKRDGTHRRSVPISVIVNIASTRRGAIPEWLP